MTAVDLLFVMGQAMMLLSLVYFLLLFIWWRAQRPADLEAAERLSELRRVDEPLGIPPAGDSGESSPHQEIAHA